MLESDDLHEVINHVVRKFLQFQNIVSVTVREDTNFDGDPLLRITVVLRSANVTGGSKAFMRLTGKLRTELKRRGAEYFPLISFISKAEAVKLDRAAA